LACRDSSGVIEGARTNESQLDARRRPSLV
jgi:hypothetical protein